MAVDRSRLPAIGPDPTFRLPSVERHSLANGIAMRTIEHRSVPVITFVLQIEGGSAADPRHQEGLAALVADMCDEGTGTLSAIDISEALARIGAEYDVDVGPDATVFTLTTLTRLADRGASLLADLVVRPSMLETDFERVRKLRLDRLAQIKDLPPAVAERAFLRVLYGDHPYGHLSIGNDAALRTVQLDDVQSFHRRVFTPERTTLVIAGAMSHQELLHTGVRAFGDWAGTSSPPPLKAADEMPRELPIPLAIIPREGAAQSELRIGHLAARRDTADYPALVVMNAVLGGQFVSRIMLKLREEKGFTYGARTGFDWRRGQSPFVLQTSVETGSTAEAIADVRSEIAAIRQERPPSEPELRVAKASLTRGYPRNFEAAAQVARSVAQLALYRLPDDYFEQFTPRIDAVTMEDVTAASQRYLHPELLTTLIVGDYSGIGPSLDTLGLGQPRILPLEM